jgi:hypothetical protein
VGSDRIGESGVLLDRERSQDDGDIIAAAVVQGGVDQGLASFAGPGVEVKQLRNLFVADHLTQAVGA